VGAVEAPREEELGGFGVEVREVAVVFSVVSR
jgi:hypothetical protein